MRRGFNTGERAVLFLEADGQCRICGVDLEPGWHADHVLPFSSGGKTNIDNGQALCPACNLKKGSQVNDLRSWQAEALKSWNVRPKSFMLEACPGAGKTRFALEVAKHLRESGEIRSITYVVPSVHLVNQTSDAASEMGLRLRAFRNEHVAVPSDAHGRVVTYQSVASQPLLFSRGMDSTLLVLDEVHHVGGKAAWGQAIQEAFDGAAYKLLMTGTPWRRDGQEIPFTNYDENNELRVDYRYNFERAWADPNRPIRGVGFPQKDAQARWAVEGVEYRLTGAEATNDDESRVLTNFHLPDSDWIHTALESAGNELTKARATLPSAQGLILARDISHAKEYGRLCSERGMSNTVIHQDANDAHGKLARFAESSTDWLIAVKMVSEGVDNPRLAVLLYAGVDRTPLAFHQALGRVIRRSSKDDHTQAQVIVPNTPTFTELVEKVDEAQRYALKEADEQPEREQRELAEELFEVINLGAVNAHHVRTVEKGTDGDDLAVQLYALVSENPDGLRQWCRQNPIMARELITTMLPPEPKTEVMTELDRKAHKDRNQRLMNRVAHRHGVHQPLIWAEVNKHFGQSRRSERRDDQLEEEGRILEEWLVKGFPVWA